MGIVQVGIVQYCTFDENSQVHGTWLPDPVTPLVKHQVGIDPASPLVTHQVSVVKYQPSASSSRSPSCASPGVQWRRHAVIVAMRCPPMVGCRRAADLRLLVAGSLGRVAAPGAGHGRAAVAGAHCLVGGRRSSHSPRHAAERTGPPLGSRLRLGPVCPRSGGRVRSSPPLLAGTRRLASPIKRGTEVWAGPGSPPRAPPARGCAHRPDLAFCLIDSLV